MKKIMKRNYKILLLLILLAFASCSFTTKTFADPDKDKLLIQVITYVLQQGHFDPIVMDDAFSEQLFKDYVENLDPAKHYFYESDIEDFKKFETNIDDQLKVYDITFFNITYNVILKRIEEAKIMYKEALAEPFDYTQDETFNTDYDMVSYVKNKREMKELWRKEMKFSTLSNYDDLYTEEKNAKEKDPEYIMKTEQVIEKVAYTWFNRLMALRFMDANDYQPIGIRVLTPKEGYTLPELLDEAKQGHIPDELPVKKQHVYDVLDGRVPSANPQNEAYKELLIGACNHLHQVFPFLFENYQF